MIPIDNITPTSQKNLLQKLYRPTIKEAIRALVIKHLTENTSKD